MKNISFYKSRTNWHLSKIHSSVDFRFFYPAIEIVSKLIIFVFIVLWLNSVFKPIEHFEQNVIAKELRRQEEYIRESREAEKKAAKYYIERLELEEKYKREEASRLAHKKLIEECAKKYKIGDRIKIYDMNAPMVKEGDHYRWSIGDIDTIINIVGYTIYCESGNKYQYNEQIDKVRSKREWRDLVYMKLHGQLTFVDIDMEGAS